MQIIKTSKTFSTIKPYISQQFGALITILCINILGIIHSEKIHSYQIFSLFFCLSAFHTMEILTLPKAQRKKLNLALSLYLCVAMISGLIVAIYQPQLPLLLTGLILLSCLFGILKSLPKAKTLFHLISFALLIWISLFSLNTNNPLKTINLFIQLFAYFSLTVALIHWRLAKVPFQYLQILFLSELLLCGFLWQWKGINALAIIIIAKAITILIAKNYWKKAPLKIFGYTETIFLTIYIILMTFI
jgi:hypothetical protein